MLVFFFFNDTATTEIYTLSLHDALPILPISASRREARRAHPRRGRPRRGRAPARRSCRSRGGVPAGDRERTSLNSSHANISHSRFFFSKKKNKELRRAHNVSNKVDCSRV